MQQVGFDQLDLTLFQAYTPVWWQHPLVLISGGCACMMVLGVLWAIARRMRERLSDRGSCAYHLRQVLMHARAQVIGRQITPAQGLAVAISVLKKYAAWRCNDPTVCAMTDQQWLRYEKIQDIFKSVLPDCQHLVQVAEQVKFNYAQLTLYEALQLMDNAGSVLQAIELAYQKSAKQLKSRHT